MATANSRVPRSVEVFCSHTNSLAEAKKDKDAMNNAANCGVSVATSSRLLELFNAEF
jgi:hypothetical protein